MTESSAGAAGPTITWGDPVAGLRLGIAPHGAQVDLCLHNTGDAPLEVLSYVDAGRRHYDWYTLQVRDAAGATRVITLLDDRDESGIVRATLASGERLRHTIDVNRWAALEANGGAAFPS